MRFPYHTPCSSTRRECSAVRPRATSGTDSPSCSSSSKSLGAQHFCSSWVGVRFFGGLHSTTLVRQPPSTPAQPASAWPGATGQTSQRRAPPLVPHPHPEPLPPLQAGAVQGPQVEQMPQPSGCSSDSPPPDSSVVLAHPS